VRDPVSKVKEWISLGPLSEFPLGKPRCFDLDFARVAVFHTEEGLFAIEDSCTHAEVHLSDGWLDGACVACPWHGAQFDLKTGAALSGPAILPVKTFVVEVVDEEVRVALPGPEDRKSAKCRP